MTDTQGATILIGDVGQTLAQRARQLHPKATLLDHGNYKQFLTSQPASDAVYYTSLGDLPNQLEVVYHILTQAGRVIYCPPAQWSDGVPLDAMQPGKCMQGLTEIILAMLPDHVRVENYHAAMADPIPLVSGRGSDEPRIWNAGCSISHGVGVRPQQRYGQLLADKLGMPCSFLTRPGSAIDWAADQILRSDIRPNDLVIWGVTSPERMTHVPDHQLLQGVTGHSFDQHPHYQHILDPANLCSHNNLYKQYYALLQVINFCDKIKANLVLINLLYGNHSIQRAFRTHKCYLHVPYRVGWHDNTLELIFSDLGSDGSHPGPQQHQQYCQLVLDHLQKRQLHLI